MMKKGFCFVAAFCLLVSLGMQAAPASASREPEVTYRIQLASADATSLQVETSIPATPGMPLHLAALPDYAGGRVVDLTSHYNLASAHDGTGAPLGISGTPGDWMVSAPSDGLVNLSYTLDLNGYRAEADFAESAAGAVPWPYFPANRNGYLYLPGYAAFIYPEGLRACGTARISLQLPEGWHAAAPLASTDGAFSANWQEMVSNLFLGGPEDLVMRSNNAAGTEMTLALAPGAGPTNLQSLDEAYGRLSALANRAAALLNRRGGAGRFLLLFSFGAEGGSGLPTYEEVASFDASATIGLAADTNILSLDSTEYLARAVFRFLEEDALSGSSLAAWFSAGAAGYYQLALPFQAGLMSSSDFWDRFSLIYTDYTANPQAASMTLAEAAALLPDASAERLMVEKGSVLVASIDQRVRDVTGKRFSLDDLMGRLAGTDGYNPGILDDAGLRANLESLTSASWKDFFEQEVGGTEMVKASNFSNLTSLMGEGDKPAGQPVESGPVKSWSWVFVILAALLIFAIPVLLEPYTLRPRKGKPAARDDS